MLRDKRGRFVKKALGGTALGSPSTQTVFINGIQRELLPGTEQAFAAYQKNHGTTVTLEDWLQTSEGSKYLKLLDPTKVVLPGQTADINTWQPSQYIPTEIKPVSIQPSENLGFENVSSPAEAAMKTNSEKIQYYYKDGQRVDLNGNPISESDYFANRDKYEIVVPPFQQTIPAGSRGSSAGINFFSSDKDRQFERGNIDKQHLANFLDFARAGLGSSINNKIADRALKAEVPFLQDVSESHRNVFGDYQAIVQGEKAAAQLRNLASRPLTSDGALQQQMQLEAQIQGQQYIDQGYAKDTELTRQTREVAWQQNKENQLQHHAAAMQNRQAMLMSERNKPQIENMRDSANYSQVIAPLLSGIEKRLRTKAAEQQHYQDYFNQASIKDEVWATYDTGLTSDQIQLRDLYNLKGIQSVYTFLEEHPEKTSDWYAVMRIMGEEERRRLAATYGVTLSNNRPADTASQYGIFANSSLYGQFAKKGGTIYKARLVKRTKDNDRAAKSIESSKKIAAKFLEKAMDSLYTYDQVDLIAKPKNKKRKYQAGGSLPFVSYTPIFATSESGAT